MYFINLVYDFRVEEKTMKNVKKIVVALVLVAVLAVGIVLGVMASDTNYTGDIVRFTTLVQAATDAESVTTIETALKEADTYITSKPIDPATEGYGDIMELYLQAKLKAVDLYITAIGGAANTDTAIKYAQNSDKWFKSAFATEEAQADERYEATLEKVHNSNIAYATALCDAVNTDEIVNPNTSAATGKADGQYRVARGFFEKACFNTEADDYAPLAERVASITEIFADAKEARYLALIAQARMDDYGKKPKVNNNFEGSVSLPTVSNNNGYDANGTPLKNTSGKATEERADGTTNTYFKIDFNGAKNEAQSAYLSTYFTVDFSGTSDRFVFEFDYTSMTTLPNSGVYFQSRPSAGTNTWMEFDGQGNIKDHNGNIIVEKAIVPGQWTHIAIVCELENINESRLYVDYAFVGYLKGDHKGYQYTPENMRVGNKGNASGQMCIDNLKVSYNGSFCKQDYLDNMQGIDKFIYLTDYMQHTGDDEVFINIPDCETAYREAEKIAYDFFYLNDDGSIVYRDVIESIADPARKEQAKAAVQNYLSYDPGEILVNYKKGVLDKYKALVDTLVAIAKAPTSTSINSRNTAVNNIKKFTSANAEFIFRLGDDYSLISLGSGTAADPYILTHGPNTLSAEQAAAGWVLYQYVATAAGELKFGSTTAGVTIGAGSSADDIAAIDDTSVTYEVAVGDVIWFAIKSTDGSVLDEDITFTTELNFGYDYDSVTAIFSEEVTRIEQDNAIYKFINTMKGFESASSLTLLQNRYDSATALVEDGLNTALKDEAGYETFKQYLDVVYANAPATIEAAKKNQNSKDIMAAINYIIATYPFEEDWKLVYIEDAVSEADIANNERYEFIKEYVSLIRSKLKGGAYNPDYVTEDGITLDIIVQRFDEINDYYYAIILGQHIEKLEAQLDVFANSQSYIEKKGILSYIQRYFNTEDLEFSVELTCENELCSAYDVLYSGGVKDVAAPACPDCGEIVSTYRLVADNAALAAVMAKYRAYEAELAPQEENYEQLLTQNTVYFLNAVKKFDTAITYVDKLALLNEAMPYYYSMNISSAEVEAAIAKYDALAAELAVVQQDSKSFIETVLLLPAVLEDEGIDAYYATLVAAATFRDKVDTSIEGVNGAIESFDTALAEYEAVTKTVNSEIKESGSVIGAFGANCGFTAILSVVMKQLFNF